jgi:hypothetical protein
LSRRFSKGELPEINAATRGAMNVLDDFPLPVQNRVQPLLLAGRPSHGKAHQNIHALATSSPGGDLPPPVLTLRHLRTVTSLPAGMRSTKAGTTCLETKQRL